MSIARRPFAALRVTIEGTRQTVRCAQDDSRAEVHASRGIPYGCLASTTTPTFTHYNKGNTKP